MSDLYLFADYRIHSADSWNVSVQQYHFNPLHQEAGQTVQNVSE